MNFGGNTPFVFKRGIILRHQRTQNSFNKKSGHDDKKAKKQQKWFQTNHSAGDQAGQRRHKGQNKVYYLGVEVKGGEPVPNSVQ